MSINNVYKLLILLPLLILGCKSEKIKNNKVVQKIDTFNLNIYSKEGNKIYSIISPNSIYDRISNKLNLTKTTIESYKNNNVKYTIVSNKSKLTNNHQILELTGNVELRNNNIKNEVLNADKFIWEINNSTYTLIGKVKFENKNIILTSNKAILGENNVIEFFNPVKYINKADHNGQMYEVISENAFYNINTGSVNFSSRNKRVRSKISF